MALLRSLARAVVLEGGIVTTEARAKEVRPRLERLITKAKTGTIANRRLLVAEIGKDAASTMHKEILPKLASRTSGYVRITKRGLRQSDASRMVQLSFVD